MPTTDATALLDRARSGDDRAFAQLVTPHRRELELHCYRILGSRSEAEDAVQDALLAAWRGLAGFEGRSSLRAWLYSIATRASLRAAERRPPRMLSWDVSPARDPLGDLGEPDSSTSWLEPWIGRSDDPADLAARRETVSLAFLAALQRLPPNQRAVLILRDVLDFSAADTAAALETSVASVTSALQRARATLAVRAEIESDAAAGPDQDRIVEQFVAAFEAADVEGIVSLLAKDVRFTMPPLLAWFDGARDVGAFFAHRSLVTPWRVRRRVTVNGLPALLADQRMADGWRPGALMVLSVHGGRIVWIASFLDPAILVSEDVSADR
ncbi:RNA polymerase subunit sigma-70 [Leifsonia sp. 2TAF2]|uniref:RNA polymerase subunit sigma-70 n=1 Tax=Leifsonia sp. 2TAF2 TaxID=3233009 RepID=UPI003F981702